MAGPALQAYRERYPQYDHIDDEELALRIHNRYYRNLDYDDYRQRVGLPPRERVKPPSVIDRVGRILGDQAEKADRQLSEDPGVPQEILDVLDPSESVPAPDPLPERGSGIASQFMKSWREYRAGWNTMNAVHAVRDFDDAEAFARGKPRPGTGGGILGVGGGEITRTVRAIRADQGDPRAIREIQEETQANRARATRDLQRAIDTRRQLIAANRGIHQSRVTREMLASDTWSAAGGAFLDDPITVMMEVAASSLPHMTDSVVLGTFGALAGPYGAAGGMGLGSAAAEYRSSFAEELIAEGVDINSAAAMIEAVHDQELMARVNRKAMIRAGVIGAFDAASAGIAGKTLTPFVKNTAAKLVTNQLGQTAAQGVLGSAGEATAQLATEGRIRPGEVLAEAVGEGPMSVVEVGVASLSGRSQQAINEDIERAQSELAEILGEDPAALELDDEPVVATDVDPRAAPEPQIETPDRIETASGTLFTPRGLTEEIEAQDIEAERDAPQPPPLPDDDQDVEALAVPPVEPEQATLGLGPPEVAAPDTTDVKTWADAIERQDPGVLPEGEQAGGPYDNEVKRAVRGLYAKAEEMGVDMDALRAEMDLRSTQRQLAADPFAQMQAAGVEGAEFQAGQGQSIFDLLPDEGETLEDLGFEFDLAEDEDQAGQLELEFDVVGEPEAQLGPGEFYAAEMTKEQQQTLLEVAEDLMEAQTGARPVDPFAALTVDEDPATAPESSQSGPVTVASSPDEIAAEVDRLAEDFDPDTFEWRQDPIAVTAEAPLWDAIEAYLGANADRSVADSPEARQAFQAMANAPLPGRRTVYRGDVVTDPATYQVGQVYDFGIQWSNDEGVAAYYAGDVSDGNSTVFALEGVERGTDLAFLDDFNREVVAAGRARVVSIEQQEIAPASGTEVDGEYVPSPPAKYTVVRLEPVYDAEPAAGPVDYSKWRVRELKPLAKKRGVVGFSRMRKAELVETLQKMDRLALEPGERPEITSPATEPRMTAPRSRELLEGVGIDPAAIPVEDLLSFATAVENFRPMLLEDAERFAGTLDFQRRSNLARFGHTGIVSDYVRVVEDAERPHSDPEVSLEATLDVYNGLAPTVARQVPIDQVQAVTTEYEARLEPGIVRRKRPYGVLQRGGRVVLLDGVDTLMAAAIADESLIDVDVYAGPQVEELLSRQEMRDIEKGVAPAPAKALADDMALEAMPVTDRIGIDALARLERELGSDARDAAIQGVVAALRQRDVVVVVERDGSLYLGAQTRADLNAAVELARATASTYTVSTPLGQVDGIALDMLPTDMVTERPIEPLPQGMLSARVPQQGEVLDMRTRPPRRSPARTGQTQPAAQPTLDMTAGANHTPIIGQEGDLPINADNERVLGNGRVVNIPETPVRREHILARLQMAFGNRIFQGRVRGRKTRLGFYRKGHGEIRIRNANDIETTAHELGHWLDENQPWISELYEEDANGQELRSVSYDADSTIEGFAEFFRLFMTQEDQAMARAPGFYDAFVRGLEVRPDIRDAVFDIQEMMHAWMIQGARARLASKVGSPTATLYERIMSWLAVDWRQKGLDGLRSAREIELAVTDGQSTEAYKKLRLALGGANGVIEATFFYGTPAFREDGQGLEFSGESLKSVFGELWGSADLALYMVARRGQELLEQGRENLLRADEIAAGLALGDNDPRFAAVFDRYQRFNERMLDFAEQAGLLSEESRAAIEEMNQNYVPFYRVVESMVDGRAVRGATSPFQRLRGGTANIASVWENIVNNMSTLVRQSLVNEAKRTLYNKITKAENQQGGLYAAPISATPATATVRTKDVLAKLVQALGMSMNDYYAAKAGMPKNETEAAAVQTIDRMLAGSTEMMQVFAGSVTPTGSVDSYMDGGRRRFMEIADAQLWDTVQFMGPRGTNLALLVLGGASNLLRRGVTATPVFQFKNFLRDTANSWILSRNVRVPAAQALRAVAVRYDKDPTYQDMLVNGGGFSSRSQALIEQGHAIYDPRGLGARYDRFMSRFENANRLAEYRAARDRGASPRDAALASREVSTDFAMRGSSQVMRVLSIAVPFLNARLQGLYGIARFGSRPTHLASIAFRGTALALATLALYAMNKDDERYDELPEDVKDLYWVFFFGNGEDDYVLIPKPYEVGMLFATLPERMFEFTEKKDGKEFADAIGWILLQAFHFDLTPQLYAPELELIANRNFAGAPIVPFYLENVEPSDQYTYYTSTSARLAGKALGLSPIKMDHRIRGYLGTVGTYALAASDAMIRAAAGDLVGEGEAPTRGETWKENIVVRMVADPLLREGPPPRTKYLTDLYDLAKETEKVANTVALRQRRAADDLEEYLERPEVKRAIAGHRVVQRAKAALRVVRTSIDNIRRDPEMTGDEKRLQIWDLTRQRNQMVRDLMKELHPFMRGDVAQ